MAKIVPRWEWRMFARQIDIEIDLRSFERTRHVESSETYLVGETSRANPKIRDGKIDIKSLESVDDQGLEQWSPAMEASFPLSTEQVARVFDSLALAGPDLDADRYDVDGFLALVGRDGRATVIRVDKIRDQYDVNGCGVEMADVIVDGDRYQTVAAEHASPDLVLDTVDVLGMRGTDNTNYINFIKRLKGLS